MKQSNSIRAELIVVKKEFITPHYIRVFFKSNQIEELSQATVGIHNKILIPPKGAIKILFPEYDDEQHQWKPQPENEKCIVRTYTHRGIDMNKREVWIDFVAHGDEGKASAWAISAQKGDILGVIIRDGEVELFPNVENYLLVGDATAIPVLSVILDSLPHTAKGVCIIEVHSSEDEQKLGTKANIEFVWLHNSQPHFGSELAMKTKNLVLPNENRFAFIAAEFTVVKEIRQYLRKEKLWSREEVDAYSYWKKGAVEDKSANERHNENANDSN
ncbi:siderophore-interacting protein [Myroides odoratimimus]|uniref:siderophore-interacting protein n=1 Tax=Myroides odoratimimus TaxID=76832 RepID=UPI003100B8B3